MFVVLEDAERCCPEVLVAKASGDDDSVSEGLRESLDV